MPALAQAAVRVAHTEQQSVEIDVCCVTADCDIASPELFSMATSVPLQAGGLIKPVSAGKLAWNHRNSYLIATDVTNLSGCHPHPPFYDAFSCDF